MGRKAKFYLNKSEALSNRILSVIEANLKEHETSAIARRWARTKDWNIEYAISLLEALKRGLLIQ